MTTSFAAGDVGGFVSGSDLLNTSLVASDAPPSDPASATSPPTSLPSGAASGSASFLPPGGEASTSSDDKVVPPPSSGDRGSEDVIVAGSAAVHVHGKDDPRKAVPTSQQEDTMSDQAPGSSANVPGRTNRPIAAPNQAAYCYAASASSTSSKEDGGSNRAKDAEPPEILPSSSEANVYRPTPQKKQTPQKRPLSSLNATDHSPPSDDDCCPPTTTNDTNTTNTTTTTTTTTKASTEQQEEEEHVVVTMTPASHIPKSKSCAEEKSKFPPLESFSVIESKRDQYVGPTTESNWVIPGKLLVGAFPGVTDDDENMSLLWSILTCKITTFCCLQIEYPGPEVAEETWRSGEAIR